LGKFGIAKEHSNTWYNVPIVELKGLALDDDFFMFEGQASRQTVDNFI